ncbi:hypothetical protein [Klenkia brasiliensis]|uniref:hypothetical protein n=1 Tax=Klenkia brasiliensis TaxID=333142 RepID=UPI000B813261|nr:hypothetical protein [Klenkia brasiliensis]
MPFVLTVDQQGSRRGPDRVAGALDLLSGVPVVLRFERTAGDEFQGVLDRPAAVVDAVVRLVRAGGWSVGIGAGPVQQPLPDSTRAAAGPAFVAARRAVDAAKNRPLRLAVQGADDEAAADAQATATVLALLLQRRSPQAWEAIDLVAAGATQAEAAARLGISRQAVGQRLTAAAWEAEQDLHPVLARLLARAEGGPRP